MHAFMCCFSRPVESVNETQIFTRTIEGGRQLIVYSMELSAREELAMILPIPVRPATREEDVQFVSLERYPHLFQSLKRGFPPPRSTGLADALRGKSVALAGPAPLRVLPVGNYVASFVPTIKDFKRLDERFCLPEGVWEKFGDRYLKSGFAVFKLKEGRARIHPMAFLFPTATPQELFFPTVHIHDGRIHEYEHFDHALYCQTDKSGLRSLMDWEESAQPASKFVNIKETQNLIIPDRHVRRRVMVGRFANRDVSLRVA